MAIDYTWKRIGDAASVWEPMAKYKIAQTAAAKVAAIAERDKLIEIEQWGAERRTKALEVALAHHATTLNNISEGIGTGAFSLDDPINLGIYTKAFTNFNKTQRDYYESAGIKPTGDTITHLTPFFASIFDKWSKDHPKGDPAALKWGKEKGVWGDVIKELDPDIKRDDAQAVWDKVWKSKFGDRKKRLLSGEGLIPTSPTSMLMSPGGLIGESIAHGLQDMGLTPAKVYGAPIDYITGGLNAFGIPVKKPFLGSEWFTEKFKEGDEWLAGMGSNKPTITPSGKHTPMGPFASPGFLSGATDYIKQQATPFGVEAPSSQDIETLDETLKSLQEFESDAKKRVVSEESVVSGGGVGKSRERGQTISQEAASFLAKLIEYMTAYGPDEARALLELDFSKLSRTAQNELQSHLMTESEALA